MRRDKARRPAPRLRAEQKELLVFGAVCVALTVASLAAARFACNAEINIPAVFVTLTAADAGLFVALMRLCRQCSRLR